MRATVARRCRVTWPWRSSRPGDESSLMLDVQAMRRDSLHRIVQRVSAAPEHIASASQQIAAGDDQEPAQAGTDLQGRRAMTAASSMEEMTWNVKQNADNTHAQASMLAKSAPDVAPGGRCGGQGRADHGLKLKRRRARSQTSQA